MGDEQRERSHHDIKTMEERNQGRWDKRMMPDYCWSIKKDLNNIKHDRQSRENLYHSSNVHEGFISAVNFLKDLMKILVGFGIFNRVIFEDLGFDCYCNNSIRQ